MSTHNLRKCKNFISCQDCKHEDGCVAVGSCVGYCLNKITCIETIEASDYCYGCNKFADKNLITSSPCGNYKEKAPLNSEEKEKRKMMEFFFPKQKKPNNPDDPWEFL